MQGTVHSGMITHRRTATESSCLCVKPKNIKLIKVDSLGLGNVGQRVEIFS